MSLATSRIVVPSSPVLFARAGAIAIAALFVLAAFASIADAASGSMAGSPPRTPMSNGRDAALSVGTLQGGDVDPSFDPGAAVELGIWGVALQADGKIVIGQEFTLINGVRRGGVARLNSDGSLDTTFMSGITGTNGPVISVALQPDGKVLIGGDFSTFNWVSRVRLARLNTDGSLDTGFLGEFNGPSSTGGNPATVATLAVQPDGKVLIGGSFFTFSGVTRRQIARLNADGSLDTTFMEVGLSVHDNVAAIAVQPDGKVLIGGRISTVNGVSRKGIARLNVDGSLDTTFLNGLTGVTGYDYPSVDALAVQPDGRVLIGGYFTTVNGVSRMGIARLNADGSLDTTFLNGLAGIAAFGDVRALAVQRDGKVMLGGYFTSVNGVSRGGIARLNADGSLDTTFMNGRVGASSHWVQALALQPDGRVVIADRFTEVNGVYRRFIARLYGPPPVAATITDEPSPQVAYDGCCAVFTVAATGAPLDYQWQKDGIDLQDGAGISGSNTATLTLTAVDAFDEGAYRVVVTNVLGTATSADAALTVVPVPLCKVASCDPIIGCMLTDAPMPKTKGYYRKLCGRNELTAAEATCAAQSAPMTFGDTDTVAEVCDEVNGFDSDPPSQCTKDETELLVLALNICSGRVCASQPIDSQHGDNTTVMESLVESDLIFGDPARDEVTCRDGAELAKEINTGTALGMDTLRLDKTPAGETSLTWSPPFLGAGQSIVRYEVWRSLPGGDAFVMIHTGTSTGYIDATGGDFEYEVLVEIQE